MGWPLVAKGARSPDNATIAWSRNLRYGAIIELDGMKSNFAAPDIDVNLPFR